MAKRTICGVCSRPSKTCVCKIIKQVPNETEVIIWQHPSEQHHPKGTAGLLNLCLLNSRIVCSEVSTPGDLGVNQSECVLLYPEEGGAPGSSSTNKSNIRQILVLDGTWRKSRKMMYLNPWLYELPRLAIVGESGAYKIRKAESLHQLSTFESVVRALKMIQPDLQLENLDSVFDNFVSMYLSNIPRQKRNS